MPAYQLHAVQSATVVSACMNICGKGHAEPKAVAVRVASLHLMRLFWLEACFTNVSRASRTESVTLYLEHVPEDSLKRAVSGRYAAV